MELVLKETTGPLPTSHFELLNDRAVIGELQLRHMPSKSPSFPEGFENHIYYEIRPEFRGKGYGAGILGLGLEEARKLGLEEVVLTCVESNVASQKVIEANGGTLLDSQPSTTGELVRKYVIKL